MYHRRTNSVVLATSAGLLGLALADAPASAQDSASEAAIVRNADDASLAWGPCPEFMPAGQALPVHWHTSAERMVLIAGELRVDFEGQDAVVLKAGAYSYGPPRRAHGGACISATPCILFIAFEVPVDAVPGKGG
jgi:hypothetical protein